ncbi:unnamed protein product [Trichogramma brassicae]|uniref:Uncharacterized protein n=1 Tax=Trichogramma brassicae TaxID=86971 RepID=A0A6H5J4B1_9HYME|nr:unnamed protein product [Trichogramma brassicae]
MESATSSQEREAVFQDPNTKWAYSDEKWHRGCYYLYHNYRDWSILKNNVPCITFHNVFMEHQWLSAISVHSDRVNENAKSIRKHMLKDGDTHFFYKSLQIIQSIFEKRVKILFKHILRFKSAYIYIATNFLRRRSASSSCSREIDFCNKILESDNPSFSCLFFLAYLVARGVELQLELCLLFKLHLGIMIFVLILETNITLKNFNSNINDFDTLSKTVKRWTKPNKRRSDVEHQLDLQDKIYKKSAQGDKTSKEVTYNFYCIGSIIKENVNTDAEDKERRERIKGNQEGLLE